MPAEAADSPWSRPEGDAKTKIANDSRRATVASEDPRREAELEALSKVRGLVAEMQRQQDSRDGLERKALRWAGVVLFVSVMFFVLYTFRYK